MAEDLAPPQRSTFWLALLLTIALLVIGYIAVTQLAPKDETAETPPAPPPTSVGREPENEAEKLRFDELQGPVEVQAPPITDLESIEVYTAGKPIPPPTTERLLTPYEDDEHIYGNRQAPYSLVQYANFTNRYAALLYPEIRSFIEANNDINLVFRHYPLTRDPADYLAAQASECIYQQLGDDAFWNYVDRLYTEGKAALDRLVEVGGEVGANTESLQTCIDTLATKDYAILDKQRAQIYSKVLTTPSYFFVNNTTGELRFVEGANSIAYMESVLEAMR